MLECGRRTFPWSSWSRARLTAVSRPTIPKGSCQAEGITRARARASTEPSRNTPLDPIEPSDPMGQPETPDVDPSAVDPDAINFGSNKPERSYDDFLLAALGGGLSWGAALLRW